MCIRDSIGTNVLNEAFLERFCVTFEQDYASPAIETKILRLHSASVGCHDDKYIKHLVDWADIIRRTFYDGGIDEVISTRRLVSLFNQQQVSILLLLLIQKVKDLMMVDSLVQMY